MRYDKITRLGPCALLCALLCACGNPESDPTPAVDYSDTTFWYAFGDRGKAADVFYVYPTVSAFTPDENEGSWLADITRADVREEARGNQRFNAMLYAEYNFFAPYYRQMSFGAYGLPDSLLREQAAVAASDVAAAFRHYMREGNGGRPFFLVGHSQGSQMLVELLKHGMTDEERELMVAAYCIGYRVTADERARYPERLAPAADSVVTGRLVLFNSTALPEAVSPVSKGDVAGVNPLTWTADTATASADLHLGMARYNASRDSIVMTPCPTRVRLRDHVAVCPDLDPGMAYVEAYDSLFPYGNLHFADSWLFAGNVKANMACRLRHWMTGSPD